MIFGDIWNTVLYIPILNLLVLCYKLLFNNIGLAIIAMTAIIKLATHPFTKSSLEIAKKQKELQPKINELKEKYKDKTEFAQKQMDLYKEHGINPVSGCLPQIIQLIIVIALYQVFTNLLTANGVNTGEVNNLTYNIEFLKFKTGEFLNTSLLYWDLHKPDPLYILPVLAAAAQFIMSKWMMPVAAKLEKVAEKTPDKSDDLMYNMQSQMTYMMPIMTLVIGVNLPSGLVLYWLISTLLSIFQFKLINNKSSNGKSK
jgi:YidC/Oxa1 family membrane protein insertase